MKLSTRGRYGTRMMLDLGLHRDEGPVQIGEIARRLAISVKYLEQLIIPLKKADFITSVRGPKGGHMLSVSPKDVTVGEIVKVLEGGIDLTDCIQNPEICPRSGTCVTRDIWTMASEAMYDKLNSITLANMIEMSKAKS